MTARRTEAGATYLAPPTTVLSKKGRGGTNLVRSDVYITRLERNGLQDMLPYILNLEGTSGLPPWTEGDFMAEYAEKWQHSRWIRQPLQELPIGYAIVSRKTGANLHLHRMVVNPTGRGYGSKALLLLIKELGTEST